MSDRDEIPDEVMERAHAVWVSALEDGTPDAAHIIARAIMEGRERGLLDAKAAVHCGCDNYCDFDEAEEKIDDLIAAIRSGKSEQGGER